MPPRRKKNSKFAKDKRARATEIQETKLRLMQISFEVDDHVYANRLIPAKTAQSYIQEISALKLCCGDDIHSLQVIEKLTRLMTKIIAEEIENIGNIGTNSTDIFKQPMVTEEPLSRSAIHATCSDSIRNQYENKAIESIDLCDDDDNDAEKMAINADINSEVSQMVDLSTALSALSTEDNVIDLRSQENALIECSQSILNTYSEHLNDAQGIEEYDRIWKSTTSDSNSKTLQNMETKTGSPTTKPNTPKKPKKRSTSKTLCTCEEHTNKATETKKKIANKTKPAPKKNPQAKPAPTSEIRKQKTRRRSTVKISTIPSKPQTQGMEKTLTTNMHQFPRRIEAITDIPINSNMNQTGPTQNTPSKLIMQDLSWVENIRYIREIQSEEYIHMDSLSESFWSNCEFPAEWDEGQFSLP